MPTKPKSRTISKTKSVENFTLRLDPKLKYLAELAARSQRRSLTSFIEAAIDKELAQTMPPHNNISEAISFKEMDQFLWDVDEVDRFVKLAIYMPSLLSYDEQHLWKLIRENGGVWLGTYINGYFDWDTRQEQYVDIKHLRKCWDDFKAVANGTADESILPTWTHKDPREPKS